MDEFGDAKGYAKTVHIEMSPSMNQEEVEVVEEEVRTEDLNMYTDGQKIK